LTHFRLLSLALLFAASLCGLPAVLYRDQPYRVPRWVARFIFSRL
jgi:hypothetical protein